MRTSFYIKLIILFSLTTLFCSCQWFIPVDDISLDRTSASIMEQETLLLKVMLSPSDATDDSVIWSSDNNGVATVSPGGVVKAISEGETTITVKSVDSGLTASCKVIVTAEYVDFPDPIFRQYMIENFDLNNNGKLSLTEAVEVTNIAVITDNIESLEGIEYCPNLSKLVCHGSYTAGNNKSYGSLKSLNVSKNTSLKGLSCFGNQLTTLDVSKNTELTSLNCSFNQLTSLDVSSNTALTTLNCYSNQLTSLDVSNNTKLEDLYCYSNQLTSLDVSGNTALTTLHCYSNQLTSLDVSNNTKLWDLKCYSNQLTSLDVSSNTALTWLYCYSNQLTSLDVSSNTALTMLHCYSNQLTSLDVSNNTKLWDLYCYSNQLTSLDVSSNTALTTLHCYSNQLTSLDVSNNTKLRDLKCYSNQLINLDVSKNKSLELLYCSPMSSLKTLYMANGQIIYKKEVPDSTTIVRK